VARIFGAEKPISWAKPAHYDFFTIKFTVWSHILSTGGDALRLLLLHQNSCYDSSIVRFFDFVITLGFRKYSKSKNPEQVLGFPFQNQK
jgi:hypothetical protein